MPYGETGYIEQGYANVAALPYEMQLMDVQNRRLELEQNQISTRGMRRTETDDVQDRQRADEFTGWLQDNPDAQTEEIIGWQKEKGYQASKRINEMIGFDSTNDDRITKMGSNQTQRKRNEIDSKLLDDQSENLQEQLDAAALQRKANTMNAENAMKQATDVKAEDISQNTRKYAAEMSAAFDGNPEIQTTAIALATRFAKSDNEQEKEWGRSLYQISSAFTVSNNLEQVQKSFFDGHKQVLNEYSNLVGRSSFNGVPINGDTIYKLLMNSETRDDALNFMSNNLKGKGASEDTIDRFTEMTDSLSGLSSIQEDKKKLLTGYSDYLAKAKELSSGTQNPEKVRELEDLGANLNAIADRQVGYFANKNSEISQRIKTDEESTSRQKDRYDLLTKIQTYEQAPRKLAISELRGNIAIEVANNMSRLRKTKMATDILDSEKADQIFPELGNDYGVQDIINAIDNLKDEGLDISGGIVDLPD